MGVAVRGGAFERNSRSLSSGVVRGLSMIAGIKVCPASFQRARRLKPSTTSKLPSSAATTRMGSSRNGWPVRCSTKGLRSRSRLVRKSAAGMWATTGEAPAGGGITGVGTAEASGSFMAMPGSQGRAAAASHRRSRDQGGSPAASRPDRPDAARRPRAVRSRRRDRARKAAGG